jgi:hypothetical protein
MRATIRARYGLLMWRSPSLSMANVIQQCRIAQKAYGDFDKVTRDSGLAVLKPLERICKDDDSVGHSPSLSVLRSRS